VHKPSVCATNLLLRDFLVAKPYAATETDRGYPDNLHLEIENCIPVLKRLKRRPDPEGRAQLEQMMKDRLQQTGIMEVLVDTQHWLIWVRRFGPISGHDAKLGDPFGRYNGFWKQSLPPPKHGLKQISVEQPRRARRVPGPPVCGR
jgi:hypothetical protein